MDVLRIASRIPLRRPLAPRRRDFPASRRRLRWGLARGDLQWPRALPTGRIARFDALWAQSLTNGGSFRIARSSLWPDGRPSGSHSNEASRRPNDAQRRESAPERGSRRRFRKRSRLNSAARSKSAIARWWPQASDRPRDGARRSPERWACPTCSSPKPSRTTCTATVCDARTSRSRRSTGAKSSRGRTMPARSSSARPPT
ncbi:hypothetical protein HRbin08_00942 [bacterium HR08]|nr:hypothetical protein HRbin08_00942 [bacterium HR08]